MARTGAGDEAVRAAVQRHALAHPVWGHRKVCALVRHDGIAVSEASVLRIMHELGLCCRPDQKERRQLTTKGR
ncbi:transposase [Georgenia sp. M64]|uniref:transposase n=1 Tax=Georgenia sp. M64 TaxID=3120520 RepID=UPI0030DEC79E